MRDLLTWLGIALILALSAALAAPFLVDSEALRLPLAAQLSRISGATVRLDGPIHFKILPTPRLEAENFSLSGPSGSLRAHRAELELAFVGLAQGRPHLALARFDGGDLLLAAERGGAMAPGVDALSLKNFRVALVSGGRVIAQNFGVDLDATLGNDAFSLRGALDDGAGGKISFSAAGEGTTSPKTLVKLRLSGPEDGATLTLDGVVLGTPRLAFEGAADFAAELGPGPLRGKAVAVIGADGVWLRDIEARLGEGPLAPKISGSLRYALEKNARLTLALAVDRLDAAWSDRLEGFLVANRPGWSADFRLAIGAAAWRGVDWSDVELAARPGAALALRASAPGATRIDWRPARVEQGWRGAFSLKSDDFSVLAAQFPALKGVSAHHVELAGDLALQAEAARLATAKIALDGANFSGELAYVAAPREKISARLETPELDLDAAPALAALSGADLDVQLGAKKLVSTRLRAEGGRLDAHILREGAQFRLDRLDVAAPGGAVLSANGGWGENFSGLTGQAQLKAAQLGPLADVLARLFPSSWSDQLARRAKIFSPAEFSAQAGGAGLKIEGVFAATRFALEAPELAAPAQNFQLELSTPEGGALLAQLGLEAVGPQKLGPARLHIGKAQGGGQISGMADLAGLRAEFSGARDMDGVAGELKISGATDLAPALSPLDFSAHLQQRDGAVVLSKISGVAAGNKFSGDLSWDAEGGRGALFADVLSAPALAALILGEPAPVKAGALWSSLSFAPVTIDPPALHLAVETKKLAPLDGAARFDLTLGPGLLSLQKAEMTLSGGVLRGDLDLRRGGGQATLRGALRAENIFFENPAGSAKISGALNFAGGGANAAALIGSLAGEGEVSLRDLSLAQAASGSSEKVLRAGALDDRDFDAQRPARQLDQYFSEAPWRRDQADFTAGLAGGVLTLTPKEGAALGVEAGVDLRDATFWARRRDAPTGEAAEAAGIVVWSGPWRAPERKIDAAGLVNLLALRALEREHRKIERQKAEDRARLLLAPAPLPPLPH